MVLAQNTSPAARTGLLTLPETLHNDTKLQDLEILVEVS